MANFTQAENNDNSELATVQSHYRTINASLQAAKRRGSKADVRELTRSKARISARLDQLKSQMNSHNSY